MGQPSDSKATLSNIWIRRAVVESRPEVGSSSSSKLGLISISWPMLTLFFSPPDIPLNNGPPIMLFLQLVNPSSVITCSTCCSFFSLLSVWGSLSSAVNKSVSFTVRPDRPCRAALTDLVELPSFEGYNFPVLVLHSEVASPS
nr:ABC transporter G family member 6 [Ipomoea batatas]GMC54121.1 ABC transporter G family member 6 [Ipomoea batatas]GMC55968.1 ABC transporter G family member 6 [Ipomoea batatas]